MATRRAAREPFVVNPPVSVSSGVRTPSLAQRPDHFSSHSSASVSSDSGGAAASSLLSPVGQIMVSQDFLQRTAAAQAVQRSDVSFSSANNFSSHEQQNFADEQSMLSIGDHYFQQQLNSQLDHAQQAQQNARAMGTAELDELEKV